MIIVTTVVLAEVLPGVYDNLFDVRINPPYISYGAEAKVFYNFRNEEGKEPVFIDSKGRKYTRTEFLNATPSINPFFHIKNGTMPDSINGIKVDVRQLQRESFMQMTFPYEFSKPEYQLYPLMESVPETDLTWPKDFFRVNDRIEFINAKTNRIDEAKSVQYTGVMKSAGFVFPAGLVAGMPTNMKQWDDGWFLTDKAGDLYHLKLVKGQPYFVKITKPGGLRIRKIICNSFQSREFYATVITSDNKIYLLEQKDYKLVRLPVDDYDPSLQTLQLTGSLFNKTVQLGGEGSIKVYAIDRENNKIDEYYQSWPVKADMTVGTVFSFLFPFRVEMEPANSQFIHFEIVGNKNYKWVYLNLLLLGTFLVMMKVQGRKFSRNILDLLVVAVTGVFGFIAVNIFTNKEY